jgi:hypothetical protein
MFEEYTVSCKAICTKFCLYLGSPELAVAIFGVDYLKQRAK